MRKIILICCFVATCAFAKAPVAAQHAMVVSEQALASQIGINILKQHGNAIDAAVAVGYALAVVHPCCGNLGGGGFMTIHFANGKNIFINFRERAPLQATPSMYLDKNGNEIPNKSTQGYLAVAVPGTVLGFETALKKYGKLSRQAVMAPAIKLAELGYKLSAGDIAIYSQNADLFKNDPNVAKIFLKNGNLYQVGDTFIQKDLAHTLKLISDKGAQEFYQGSIAKKIVAASQKNAGILSLADFANYQVEELTPIYCTYHDKEIISAPPPSSGGVTLCEILSILQGYPISQYGFHTQSSLHYMIEAMRFAFADRNLYLGDPDFVTDPIQFLLSKNHAAMIRKHIDPVKATLSSELPLQTPPHERNQTTHYSIIDQWGNAVSVTITLNGYYGANVIASDTGFLLNDEMDDFATKPGSANQFGLVQGTPNDIAPGKRPLSSMTPTIVLLNKKVMMVIGSPGGPRIITSVLEAMLNTLDFHMNIQDAVNAKRFHQQWLPDVVYLETQAISIPLQTILEKNGYHFQTNNPWSSVEAIYVDPKTSQIFGASDDRRSAGKAVGY